MGLLGVGMKFSADDMEMDDDDSTAGYSTATSSTGDLRKGLTPRPANAKRPKPDRKLDCLGCDLVAVITFLILSSSYRSRAVWGTRYPSPFYRQPGAHPSNPILIIVNAQFVIASIAQGRRDLMALS